MKHSYVCNPHLRIHFQMSLKLQIKVLAPKLLLRYSVCKVLLHVHVHIYMNISDLLKQKYLFISEM